MPVHEVKRAEWPAFFRRFSDQHRGWLVTVELLAPAGGRVQASGVPLEQIELRDAELISVQLGGQSPEEKTLPAPEHVRVERTAHGADTTLSIEAESGAILLLRFHSPMLPQEVDGVP
jgi:hypothetical protein